MKLMMVLMGMEIGGAETHVAELSLALQARGHEVLVVSNGGAYVPLLEEAGIRHIWAPLHRRAPKAMAQSYRILRRVIAREQPDLVHAHARIPAFLCGLLQRQLHFPLITTAHWVFQVTPLLRLMTNWGDRTVAVSQDIRTYLMEEYQVPADQIHVTINGIDTEKFAPGPEQPGLREELGLGDGPIVAAIGRLDSDRAQSAELLTALAPRLLTEYPTAQLLLVGGGDREQAIRTQAETVNRQLGRNAIVMTGPRTDIAALLKLPDVFVGASRAVLEAMSAGVCAILSGNEGYMGLLEPEKLPAAMDTNFCFRGFPPATEEALLRDLQTLLSRTPAQRQKAGQFGRQVVLAHYSVSRMAQDYLLAYDRLLHGPRPYHAVISGYYGYGNLGDDSILETVQAQLSALEPPVRLTVLSRHPKATRQQFGLPAVHRFDPLAVRRAMKKSDLLISGGGTLLQDKTSARSLWYYLWVMNQAHRLHKPVFLFANGIGPVSAPARREKVRRAVEQCAAVTLRDPDSLQELRAMGVTRANLLVTADPAFTLVPAPGGRDLLAAQGVPTDRPLLGISVRRVPGIDSAVPAFAALCDRLSRDLGYHIVFLMMQQALDLPLSQAIAAAMTQPASFAAAPGKPTQMLAMVGQLDALVSMRLHTVIFAAKQRVPVVGCVYDPKVAAFLRMIEMPDCGTPETLDPEDAFQTVKALLLHREQAVQTLDGHLGPLETQAAQTTQQLGQLLRHMEDKHGTT